MHENFIKSDGVEPHRERNRAILKKYPEIADLQRPCPRTKYIVFLMVAFQLYTAYFLREAEWWRIFLAAVSFGGVINHACSLAAHELSHNAAFRSPTLNRILAIFSDVPKMVPSSITFRIYHMEHHMYQGVSGVDMDVATDLEAWAVGHDFVRKSIFIFLQVFFYGLRPVFVRPKSMTMWEITNSVLIILSDFAIFSVLGWKSTAYLLLSSLLGHGICPVAGHFIAEHYVYVQGHETYDYLGPLNWLTFNVGYHTEHHDFPKIPGSLLPEVRRIAAEFYEDLPVHKSWVKVVVDFIWNPKIGLNSRMVRPMSKVKAVLDPE